MSKEKQVIPGASKYSIDAEGAVTNNKSNTPVFPKAGKVALYADNGKRESFVIDDLVSELFGGKKAVAKPATKVVAEKPIKKEGKRSGTIIQEIQALFAKGKDKEKVLALGKYNKSTVGVQWGKFKKANEKK